MPDNERREGNSPARICSYNPHTDFEAVKAILQEEQMFDNVWDAEEKLRRAAEEDSSAIIVAIVGEEVVGTVFQTDRLYPYFWRLVVRRDFRQKGIGEQLLDEVEQQLVRKGHTEIGIFVEEGHEDIKNWYVKRGFQPTDLYRAMWKPIKPSKSG